MEVAFDSLGELLPSTETIGIVQDCLNFVQYC